MHHTKDAIVTEEEAFLPHGRIKLVNLNSGDAMRRIETTMNRREYHILRCVDPDPYYEEYGNFNYRTKGYRGWKKTKRIWCWQQRMYRTWKHNRNTQYKNR